MGEPGCGGLNLMLLQLVDWIFCGQRECMGEAGRRKRGEGEGREGGDGVTEVHGGQRLQKLIVITWKVVRKS